MTEITEKPAAEDDESMATSSGNALWLRVMALAIACVVVASFAIFGFSTVYCQSFGGALFWIFFIGMALPVAAMVNLSGYFFGPLAGFLIAIWVVCRFSRFRLTLAIFVVAIVASFLLSVAITWGLDRSGICAIW